MRTAKEILSDVLSTLQVLLSQFLYSQSYGSGGGGIPHPQSFKTKTDGTMAHDVGADITDNEKKKQLPMLTIIDPTEFCIFPI